MDTTKYTLQLDYIAKGKNSDRRIEFYMGPVAQSVQRLNNGLDSPGSNSGGDEIFRPFRPALGPTQPPVQRVLGLSRG